MCLTLCSDMVPKKCEMTDSPPGVKLLQIDDTPPVFLANGMPATGHKVTTSPSTNNSTTEQLKFHSKEVNLNV